MRKISLILLIIYAIFIPKTKNTPQVLVSSNYVDSRPEKLTKFFEVYNPDLVGNVSDFIRVADRFNLDWRLLPAISGSESTFGKHTPSCANYNIFGWTSTSSPCGFWRFESYSDAINLVGEKIATKNAYSSFQRTGELKELAFTYNPGGTEAWIEKVEFFMNKLE